MILFITWGRHITTLIPLRYYFDKDLLSNSSGIILLFVDTSLAIVRARALSSDLGSHPLYLIWCQWPVRLSPALLSGLPAIAVHVCPPAPPLVSLLHSKSQPILSKHFLDAFFQVLKLLLIRSRPLPERYFLLDGPPKHWNLGHF